MIHRAINLDYFLPTVGLVPSDWNCEEFECEDTGIKLGIQIRKPNFLPAPTNYYACESDSDHKLFISEEVYNIIKKLLK